MEITDRTVLIMDEVDGMSAGDRGGVAALISLIKKTKVGQNLLSTGDTNLP
jgi:replication factor C subunit 1